MEGAGGVLPAREGASRALERNPKPSAPELAVRIWEAHNQFRLRVQWAVCSLTWRCRRRRCQGDDARYLQHRLCRAAV